MAVQEHALPASMLAKPQAGTQSLTGSERQLWEACDSARRQPTNRLAVVLHLSRLAPPAPRAHHIRVARVLLQDAAARFGGQVFAMRNQDLVLLCDGGARSSGLSTTLAPEPVLAPDALPATLAKLFAADVPDPGRLTSLWRIDREASSLVAYLSDSAAGFPPEDGAEDRSANRPDGVLSLAALQGILAKAPLADLMVQQVGMSLSPERGKTLADRLSPAFRTIEVSLAALDLGPLVASATGDPYLLRHLASGLDAQVIQLLAEDLTAGGRLTRPSVKAGLPIHIELGLEAILSPSFARLCRRAAGYGVRFGACIPLMQACADLDLMEHASRVLKLTGGDLVIGEIDPSALSLIAPAALRPDLLKLVWSPSLLATHGQGRSAACLAGIAPARIVLQNVDSQLALAWAQAHGIGMVQGPFLDQVQAATRMASCHSSGACTLRQCIARGSAVGVPGRTGCGNPALLDGGGIGAGV